jgi:hypothetical protein
MIVVASDGDNDGGVGHDGRDGDQIISNSKKKSNSNILDIK